MAKVNFDAFVEDVARGARTGEVFALRTAETHRRKDPDNEGKYITTARTYRQVKLNRHNDRGHVTGTLEGFVKGDRVHVEGTEKTERFTTDGRDLYTLTVYADVVEPVTPRGGSSYPATGPRSTSTAPQFVPDEEPF